MTEGGNVTHPAPLLEDHANFVIQAQVPDSGHVVEQLWVRRREPGLFEVCCIPFLLYDVGVGDIVRWSPDDGRVVTEQLAGRYVARLWFGESKVDQAKVVAALEHLGARTERCSPQLLAVDCTPLASGAVDAALVAGHERGDYLFERGRQLTAPGQSVGS